MSEIDISDLTFEINCAIPGGRPYSQTLDLPLIVSMLSSYFQHPIPPWSLFIGEVDLYQEVRPLPDAVLDYVVARLAQGTSPANPQFVDRIHISEQNVKPLNERLATAGLQTKVHGVSTLESLVRMLWPDASEA